MKLFLLVCLLLVISIDSIPLKRKNVTVQVVTINGTDETEENPERVAAVQETDVPAINSVEERTESPVIDSVVEVTETPFVDPVLEGTDSPLAVTVREDGSQFEETQARHLNVEKNVGKENEIEVIHSPASTNVRSNPKKEVVIQEIKDNEVENTDSIVPDEEYWLSILSSDNVKSESNPMKEVLKMSKHDINHDIISESKIVYVGLNSPTEEDATEISVAQEEIPDNTERPVDKTEIVGKISKTHMENHYHKDETHVHEEQVVDATEVSVTQEEKDAINTEAPVVTNEIVAKFSKTHLKNRHHHEEIHEDEKIVLEATEMPEIQEEEISIKEEITTDKILVAEKIAKIELVNSFHEDRAQDHVDAPDEATVILKKDARPTTDQVVSKPLLENHQPQNEHIDLNDSVAETTNIPAVLETDSVTYVPVYENENIEKLTRTDLGNHINNEEPHITEEAVTEVSLIQDVEISIVEEMKTETPSTQIEIVEKKLKTYLENRHQMDEPHEEEDMAAETTVLPIIQEEESPADEEINIVASIDKKIIVAVIDDALISKNEIVEKVPKTQLDNMQYREENQIQDEGFAETTIISVINEKEDTIGKEISTDTPTDENEYVEKIYKSQLAHDQETTAIGEEIKEPPIDEKDNVEEISESKIENHHHDEIDPHMSNEVDILTTENPNATGVNVDENELVEKNAKTQLENSHLNDVLHEHEESFIKANEIPFIEDKETVIDGNAHDVQASSVDENIESKKVPIVQMENHLHEEGPKEISVINEVKDSIDEEIVTEASMSASEDIRVDEKSDYWLNMMKDQNIAAESSDKDVVAPIVRNEQESAVNKLRIQDQEKTIIENPIDETLAIFSPSMDESDITGLEGHPANRRISAQMAHLARKYGLRPLTKRTYANDYEERRRLRNKRRNRKHLIRTHKTLPILFHKKIIN